MEITFLGANGTVTGSKYLLEDQATRVLVDCGLFQGYKTLRLRNWNLLPVDPRTIDFVLLTHAHIDHSGYLPLLIKRGFRGKVYCSQATLELCEILLPDSGYLQEEEARLANKYGYSKHKYAEPLYTKEDALFALKFFHVVDFNKIYSLGEEMTFQLFRAGHIFGSSFVKIQFDGTTSILFSGDLGRSEDKIMKPPSVIQSADYLVLESTYGDRLHSEGNVLKEIKEIVNRTVNRGGSVIIPSFAVGRAQMLLYYLYELMASHQIPQLPVFLDSPMAISATKIFCAHAGEHKLSLETCHQVCDIAEYVNTPKRSKEIGCSKTPVIIISASGMVTGGRILHHVKSFAPDERNTILFVGFQASGTRGDRLVRGEKKIKIHGQFVSVRAEVEMLSNVSSHADYQEILNWLSHFNDVPRNVFITHGEPHASLSLKEKIEKRLSWTCSIPEYLQKEAL